MICAVRREKRISIIEQIKEPVLILKNTKKYIWIFLLCCLPLSNILWYTAYSAGDESVSTSFVILTSFLPAMTSLILCKISREGWENLMILPNIKKAWKIYLFAVAGALVMTYLNELLMYLMFRGEVSFQAGAFTLRGLGEIVGMTILGVLASVEMLGEEPGWLGWLFPKLEKLHGTKDAMLLLALIRTIWHLGILIFLPHPLIGLCDLFLSNLLLQGFLVYLTKKSASLFPAAVVHAVTNLLPALVAYSDLFYQAHIVPMNEAGLLSAESVIY